jgi:hypothetical protein
MMANLRQTLEQLIVKLHNTNESTLQMALSKDLCNQTGVSSLFASLGNVCILGFKIIDPYIVLFSGWDKMRECTDRVLLKTIRIELTASKCRMALTAIDAIFRGTDSLFMPNRHYFRQTHWIYIEQNAINHYITNRRHSIVVNN